MTELEDKVYDIDKRQESFETFTRENVKAIRERMDQNERQTRECL